MSARVILLHGHTAAGKSELARRLAASIPETIALHSALLRRELGLGPRGSGGYRFDLDDEEFIQRVSKRVYGTMAERAGENLRAGTSVVLDAAFNFYAQRLPIYALAGDLGLPVIGVRCRCSDVAEVHRRLDERRHAADDDPFDEASELSTYESTVAKQEDIADDLGRPLGPEAVVDLDTADGRVTVLGGAAPADLLAFLEDGR